MSKYIALFNKLPKEMFRLNNGPTVKIRAVSGSIRPKTSFDLFSEGGIFKPKALDPATYNAPNGASMRPNTKTLQKTIRRFVAKSVVVYSVPEGTELPNDLVLVHERNDHFSLQGNKETTVEELNMRINNFLHTKGKSLTKEEWMEQYPTETEKYPS